MLDTASVLSLDMLVLSEGSLGRDFRIGFFILTAEGPLAGLFWDTFSSKLNRLGRKLRLLFSSESLMGESFFRANLGDLALVVGIYIIVKEASSHYILDPINPIFVSQNIQLKCYYCYKKTVI